MYIHEYCRKAGNTRRVKRESEKEREREVSGCVLEAQEEFVARNRSQQSPAARRNDTSSF